MKAEPHGGKARRGEPEQEKELVNGGKIFFFRRQRTEMRVGRNNKAQNQRSRIMAVAENAAGKRKGRTVTSRTG